MHDIFLLKPPKQLYLLALSPTQHPSHPVDSGCPPLSQVLADQHGDLQQAAHVRLAWPSLLHLQAHLSEENNNTCDEYLMVEMDFKLCSLKHDSFKQYY